MKVRCPSCQASLKVPDDKVGQVGRCPRCKQPVPLVEAEEEPAYSLDEPQPAASAPLSPAPLPREAGGPARPEPAAVAAAAEPEDAPAKPKKKKKKKKKRGSDEGLLERLEQFSGAQWALGLLGIGLVGIGLLAFVVAPLVDRVLDSMAWAPPPPIIADVGWRQSGFGLGGSVLLPEGQSQATKVLASAVPLDYLEHKPTPDTIFAIASFSGHLPPDRQKMTQEQMLNDFCDGFRANVRALGGEEIYREPVEHNGLKGVQMVSRVRSQKAKLVHRIFSIDKGVFVLLAGGKGYTPDNPDIRRFFDSFTVAGVSKPAAAPAPVAGAPAPAAEAAAPAPAPTADAPPAGGAAPAPEAEREKALAHLKAIGVALHEYEDTSKRFPPGSVVGPGGMPVKLSWRVAILPFLGKQDLYQKFNLEEAWDSPHNAPLVREMPEVFGPAPGNPADAGKTCFRALVGPGAAFEGPEGLSLGQFLDGVAATLMVVEAADAVPWTAPDEVPYDPVGPLPKLGGHFGPGFLALSVDCAVRYVPPGYDEAKLRKAITRDGKDPVELDNLGP